MKTVVVGSTNPVKVTTAKEAFAAVFPETPLTFISFAAPSGVADQPFGSDETKQGAYNRARASQTAYGEADFFVGLEGGLEVDGDAYWAFAWMCVLGKDGTTGFGRTGSFLLPPGLCALVRAGHELGSASDEFFNEHNSKQKGGTIDLLTNGLIDRKAFYNDALIFALIPFMRGDIYHTPNQ